MWRIRIHATYKTGIERTCHTRVMNAFKICDEFVQFFTHCEEFVGIIHTFEKYEVWILKFNTAFITETSPYSFGNFRKVSLYNCFMPI